MFLNDLVWFESISKTRDQLSHKISKLQLRSENALLVAEATIEQITTAKINKQTTTFPAISIQCFYFFRKSSKA